MLTASAPSGSAREDRLAAAAEAKVRDAKAAVEALKQRRRGNVSEERREIARQKIEQLKARLKALRSMASVDPKGTARMAAQIARELGAAIKAYAAGGGTTSGMEIGAAPAAPAAASATAAPVEPASGAGVSDATAPAPTGAAIHDGGVGETDEAPPQGEDPEGAGETPANPYQQAIDDQKAHASEMARRSAGNQADQDLMTEARALAAELKALIRRAAQATPADDRSHGAGEAGEWKAITDATDREIEKADADLGAGLSLLV